MDGRTESYGRSRASKSLLFCPFQSSHSVVCRLQSRFGLRLFCFFSGRSLLVWVSRDQTAVDAARSQSSLQSSLLPLGSQDGDDGLVEHRLQALLGQCRTFNVTTRTDLRRGKRNHQVQSPQLLRWWFMVNMNCILSDLNSRGRMDFRLDTLLLHWGNKQRNSAAAANADCVSVT